MLNGIVGWGYACVGKIGHIFVHTKLRYVESMRYTYNSNREGK